MKRVLRQAQSINIGDKIRFFEGLSEFYVVMDHYKGSHIRLTVKPNSGVNHNIENIVLYRDDLVEVKL